MMRKFASSGKRFARNDRGNVATIFAISVLPVLGLIGVSIDLTRINKTKTGVQAAVDSAALQIAPSATTLSVAQLKTNAQTVLSGMYYGSTIVGDPTVSADKTTVCLTASIDVPETLSKVIAGLYLTASANSCATVGGGDIEVALVLDNSGSMNTTSGGISKLSILKTSATSFTNNLFTLAPSHIKMSVVPFSDSVAVDPATYRTAGWVDTTAQSSWHWKSPLFSGASLLANSRFDIYNWLKAIDVRWDWAGCFETQPYPQNVNDVAPSSSVPDSLYVPMLAPDEPDNTYVNASGSTVTNSKSYTNNYIKDTSATCTSALPTTNTDAAETTKQSQVCKYKFGTKTTSSPTVYGPNYSCLSAPLQRLTTTQATINTKITGLTANGATNIHEGFMWGWRTISPLAPFGDGVTYGYIPTGTSKPTQKVIVLMTDGFNSWAGVNNTIDKSDYEGPGYWASSDGRLPVANRGITNSTQARAALDALTLEACANARAQGIIIYTIGFSISTDPIDTQGINMLKSCSGYADGTHSFVANDATALNSAFSSISNGIGQIRLSK